MKASESIAALASALAKFNGEVSRISKDANNPFFKNKYATLDTIIDEIRPILTKYGLSVMQFPSGDGENVSLKTILLHESGEWMESDVLTMKPVKNDPQAVGSAVTYARRYSLAAFFSLNTGEDDDGNKATHKVADNKTTTSKPVENYVHVNKTDHTPSVPMSEAQFKLLCKSVKEMEAYFPVDEIKNKMKLEVGEFTELQDLDKTKASKAINFLSNWLKQQKAGA